MSLNSTQHEYSDLEVGIVRGTRSARDPHGGSDLEYEVEIVESGACGACALATACKGTGARLQARSHLRLRIGQLVRLEPLPGSVLKATGLVYGLPLAMVLVAVFVVYLGLSDAVAETVRVGLSVAAAAIAVAMSGIAMARVQRRIASRVGLRATPLDR